MSRIVQNFNKNIEWKYMAELDTDIIDIELLNNTIRAEIMAEEIMELPGDSNIEGYLHLKMPAFFDFDGKVKIVLISDYIDVDTIDRYERLKDKYEDCLIKSMFVESIEGSLIADILIGVARVS